MMTATAVPIDCLTLHAACQPRDIHRHGAIGHSAVAKLSVGVPAPTFDGPGRGQRAGMSPTGSNGCDPTRDAHHIHGCETVGDRAVAQLPSGVVAPAFHAIRDG